MQHVPRKFSPFTPRGWATLFLLLVFGLWMTTTVDLHLVHVAAEKWTHTWWLAPALMLVQALFFAFALPGAIMFFVIGLIYDPMPATVIITVGGVAGSVMGFYIARGLLAKSWVLNVQNHQLYHFLRHNTNFLMLCAMRTLPGFPHSIINYGSGLLRVPLMRFVPSAFLGYMVKGMLYASILHNVVDADEGQDVFSLQVLWPLIVLFSLFVAGFVLQKVWGRTRDQKHVL